MISLAADILTVLDMKVTHVRIWNIGNSNGGGPAGPGPRCRSGQEIDRDALWRLPEGGRNQTGDPQDFQPGRPVLSEEKVDLLPCPP
jgi:hypothetical protein